jgi:Kef-type K+ transport system membrane component KefB
VVEGFLSTARLDLLTHHLLAFLLTTDANPLHLPLSLLLIFATAKLLQNLFERLQQPGLLGEILAGVLLGPSLFNWVRSDDVLSALAEMGVMFLLFRVGLAVKPQDLMYVGRTALAVAVLGVALPFISGFAVMTLAGASRMQGVFVGAALVATSVGITAQVLAAKGLLQERASRIILAAAVIDDVLGLLVLAVVSSVAEGHLHLISLAMTGLLAAGFTLLVAKYGARTSRRIMPGIQRKLTVEDGQFHLALVLLFALSLAAVYLGVAAIVGAFLAGMALSETVSQRVRDLAHGVTELLVPFFLANIGLHLHLSALTNRSTLSLTVVICAIAVISKFLGCGLGAWSSGGADMLRIGVGMIPRGEVGMVVAQIGLSMKVIEEPVYAAVVCMAVVTTVVAPPLLKFAFRNCEAPLSREKWTTS